MGMVLGRTLDEAGGQPECTILPGLSACGRDCAKTQRGTEQ